MSKGIIYVMSTIVEGLIKIGKTGIDEFETRMYHLEHNGYRNVTGLKRVFAIEVDDYDDKEKLIDVIFSKSRVGNTELFSLDLNLVKQLLSSFDGKVIFPKEEKKEAIFIQATDVRESCLIDDGDYYLRTKTANAVLSVKKGKLIIKKNSKLAPIGNLTIKSWVDLRNAIDLVDGKTTENIDCSSLSMAAAIVVGHNVNGWNCWKTKDGQKLDIFRKKQQD